MSIKKKSIADLKNTILSPSLTSLYKVDIPLPTEVAKFMKEHRFTNSGSVPRTIGPDGSDVTPGKIKIDPESIGILCSAASLPGSSLMTHEIMNDRTGVSEFHAHRRQFDNKMELEFYVDSDLYGPITYFEFWMNYISQHTGMAYRMQFPKNYTTDEFRVYKFEKDIGINLSENEDVHTTRLMYRFYNAFPLSINSMPVSYNTSSLLKCVVTMSYSRYTLEEVNYRIPSPPPEKKKSPKKKESKEPDPTPAVEKTQRMGMRNRMRAPGGLYGGRPL